MNRLTSRFIDSVCKCFQRYIVPDVSRRFGCQVSQDHPSIFHQSPDASQSLFSLVNIRQKIPHTAWPPSGDERFSLEAPPKPLTS